MEYLVLARKWRPQVFEDVIGQDHVVKTLKNAIKLNRTAHAYIFSGPRGTGKTSVARVMAKALNCEKGPTDVPCNQCTNCREITGGSSLDVREIDGASNRGIDEVRELIENIKFSPISSRYKIYIIDEVHMLTVPAFNALLKTLEEPPSHVVFIFATTEIHKVPATILSRCQHFDFRRISVRQIADSLGRIAKEENVSISDAGLICVARAGEGSLRDAQSIFDQVLSYSGNDVKDSDIEELLGLNDMRFVFDLSTAILDRNPGACLNIIDEAYYSGVDIKQFYQMLLDHFMKLFTLKVSDSDSVLEDSPDHEVAEFKKQNEKVSRETLRRLLDTLAGEENSIRRGLGPRINLEYVVVKMACLEPLIPIDEFVLRMERLEKDLRSEGPMVRQVVETEDIVYEGFDNGVEQEAEEVEEKAEYGDLWERFKGFVKKKSYPLWSKVEHGEFLGYGDGCFKIGFPEGSVILEYITEEPQIGNLIQVSKDFFNDDVKVKIEPLSCEKIVRNSAGNARNELLNHPLALKVIEVFEDAEIHSTNVNGKR